MSDLDFSLVGEASSEAMTFSKYFSSFGKLRIKQVLQKNAGGVWSEIQAEEYASLPDYSKDAPKGTPYRSIKLIFELDHARELALEAGRPADKSFDYRARSMSVGDKDYEGLLDALEGLRGKPFTSARTDKKRRSAEINEALTGLRGQWVESEDRPQRKWDKDLKRVVNVEKEAGSGTYWTTFYPIATYKSREEIVAAIRQRYGGTSSNGTQTATQPATPAREYRRPEGESDASWARAVKKIQKRLAAKEPVQEIADDLEIDVEYVEQFVTESPLPF